VYDAIVIGGGLVGAATAYHLVLGGARVLLADREDPGRATDAGAGILSPEANLRGADPMDRLGYRADRYYPAFVGRLEIDRAGETGYARCGYLHVAVSEDERGLLEAELTALRRRGEGVPPSPHDSPREVSPDAARRMFPPLGKVAGAIYHPDAGRVDGRLLSRAVRAAAERRGVTVVRAGASRLVLSGRRAAGVVIDGDTVDSPRIVITGGAWSAAFGRQLDVQIPVDPQRGQIIHLRHPKAETASWPILTGFRHHYMVAWPDQRVVAGATRETGSGFDPRLTAAGVREVLSEALRMAPGLADWEIQEMRVGLRPLSRDGLPVLGPVPGVEGVYLATGHGPLGLQLGPYSGKLVAALMLGDEPEMDLAPFSVARFRP